jgi:hypothetical protein
VKKKQPFAGRHGSKEHIEDLHHFLHQYNRPDAQILVSGLLEANGFLFRIGALSTISP